MPSGGHHFTVVLLGIATALIAGEVHRERIEWCDVWIPQANDSKLPRVLLVGDSITRGYYGRVAAQLANVASVARLTTSRSVCDPLFVAELRPVVEGYKWAVIHFNNGIQSTAAPTATKNIETATARPSTTCGRPPLMRASFVSSRRPRAPIRRPTFATG